MSQLCTNEPSGPGSREEKEALVADLRRSLAVVASRLGRSRRDAAGRLRAAVEHCLADLAMPDSRFDVRIGWDATDSSAEVRTAGFSEAQRPVLRQLATAWLLVISTKCIAVKAKMRS